MIPIFSAAFLLLLVTLICCLVGMLLFGYGSVTNRKNWLLALFFWLLAYPCFITLLIGTGYMRNLPHLYRTGHIASLAYMPASYLYIRSILSSKRLTKTDWLHFLPVLLYVADYLPFFLLDADTKISLLYAGNMVSNGVMFRESTLFPPGFYVVLKYVIALIYWILQVVLLVHALRIRDKTFHSENRIWLRWILLFTFSQVFLFIPPLTILDARHQNDDWTIFCFIGGLTGLVAVFIFLFPEILYGVKGMLLQKIPGNVINSSKAASPSADEVEIPLGPAMPISQSDTTMVPDAPSPDRQRPGILQYLPEKEIKEIMRTIDSHFTSRQSYLSLHYTQHQLATEIGIPLHYVSAVINHETRTNFNDYLNGHRVRHAILMLSAGAHRSQTLEAIGKQCGFGNRNTFSTAFRKYTGKTPSDYIKEHYPI